MKKQKSAETIHSQSLQPSVSAAVLRWDCMSNKLETLAKQFRLVAPLCPNKKNNKPRLATRNLADIEGKVLPKIENKTTGFIATIFKDVTFHEPGFSTDLIPLASGKNEIVVSFEKPQNLKLTLTIFKRETQSLK